MCEIRVNIVDSFILQIGKLLINHLSCLKSFGITIASIKTRQSGF